VPRKQSLVIAALPNLQLQPVESHYAIERETSKMPMRQYAWSSIRVVFLADAQHSFPDIVPGSKERS
jgi:hypothetical protein